MQRKLIEKPARFSFSCSLDLLLNDPIRYLIKPIFMEKSDTAIGCLGRRKGGGARGKQEKLSGRGSGPRGVFSSSKGRVCIVLCLRLQWSMRLQPSNLYFLTSSAQKFFPIPGLHANIVVDPFGSVCFSSGFIWIRFMCATGSFFFPCPRQRIQFTTLF